MRFYPSLLLSLAAFGCSEYEITAGGKVTNDRYQEGKSGDRLLFLVAHVGRSKLFKEYAEALADIGDGGGGGG